MSIIFGILLELLWLCVQVFTTMDLLIHKWLGNGDIMVLPRTSPLHHPSLPTTHVWTQLVYNFNKFASRCGFLHPPATNMQNLLLLRFWPGTSHLVYIATSTEVLPCAPKAPLSTKTSTSDVLYHSLQPGNMVHHTGWQHSTSCHKSYFKASTIDLHLWIYSFGRVLCLVKYQISYNKAMHITTMDQLSCLDE